MPGKNEKHPLWYVISILSAHVAGLEHGRESLSYRSKVYYKGAYEWFTQRIEDCSNAITILEDWTELQNELKKLVRKAKEG